MPPFHRVPTVWWCGHYFASGGRETSEINGLLMLASLGDELREMEERQEMKQEAESLPQVKGALAPGLSPSCYQ